ncbi:MAG: DinB family protein, partial [Rhodothermales bacterium]
MRSFTDELVEPLEVEDFVVQTMEDVSPTKWHLAHTSWFFETFVLKEFLPNYRLFNSDFPYLFNSYYVQAGERHCRDRRGYVSRPTVKEVMAYRAYVDEQMDRLFDDVEDERAHSVIEIGIHHEQQHQELILTDIKHVLSVNPLRPVYRPFKSESTGSVPGLSWMHFDEGLYEVGHDGRGYAYDNEGPRHRTYLQDFLLATR